PAPRVCNGVCSQISPTADNLTRVRRTRMPCEYVVAQSARQKQSADDCSHTTQEQESDGHCSEVLCPLSNLSRSGERRKENQGSDHEDERRRYHDGAQEA